MEKKLFDLSVSTTELDGYIIIMQTNASDNDDKIAIHPDQVDLLVKWLAEARDAINSQQSDD